MKVVVARCVLGIVPFLILGGWYVETYDLHLLMPEHPFVTVYRYGLALLFYVGAGGLLYGLKNVWKTGEMHLPASFTRRDVRWGWGKIPAFDKRVVRRVRRNERPLAFFLYFTAFVLLGFGLAVFAIMLTLVPLPW